MPSTMSTRQAAATTPLQATTIDAAQMRSQLNGLKAIIDAVPGITSVVIDSVATLPPGNAATVSVIPSAPATAK